MSQASDLLVAAIEHHRHARWDTAESLYRQALQVDERSLYAWLGLGIVLSREQPTWSAITCFERALAIEPTSLPAALHLAEGLIAIGDTHKGEQIYRKAAEIGVGSQEDFVKLYNNLGVLYHRCGRFQEAFAAYEQALRRSPNFFSAQMNLGIAYRAAGCWEQATQAYRKALSINPHAFEVYHDLGLVFDAQQRYQDAEAAYRTALQGHPESPEVWLNLGNNLKRQGRLDEAISAYQHCLLLRPDYAEAYNSLGIAWLQRRDPERARLTLEQAIAHRPTYAEALYNLGTLYEATRDHERAIQAFQQTLMAEPRFHAALDGLVHQYQLTCDWDRLAKLPERIIEIVESETSTHPMTMIHPFSFIGLPTATTPGQQLLCAQRWGQQFRTSQTFDHRERWKNAKRTKATRLRIGYLSADFRLHAVGLSIPELLESHDRDRFEIFGYSIGTDDQSAIRQRIVNAFPNYRDLYQASHAEAAQNIWDDHIDILVDLQGYTAHSRTEILAFRPAPIQIQYLGFPGTMGVDFIDYTLVDDFVVPPHQQPHFREALVYLPGCYQVNDSQAEIATEVITRADYDLPDDAFVFCSFNSSQKITAEMFFIWLEILQASPGSLLWLPAWNSLAVDNLRRQANRRGIGDDRIVFSPHLPIAQHLNRHRLANLFLDSYPYSGHGTASNALRMGLPIVTRSGESMSSRVAGSLLRELGLTELIATSPEEYAAIAIGMATNRDRWRHVHHRLQASLMTTLLFNGQAFARKIESAFIRLWEGYELQRGQTPCGGSEK